MKKINYIIATILLLIFALVLFTGCGEDVTPSLFNPNKSSGPTPILTKVLPRDSTLSGVGVMTLEGQNFSSNKAENLVFFNQTRVEVLSATATQLTIRPPDLPGAVTIKVAVHQAELFSNVVNYILKTSVSNLYLFLPTQQPYALTSDATGDIFISMVEADKGTGIKKITPDGVWTDWAPKGGETFWTGMKMGSVNTIYAVRQVRAVFQTSAGVISSAYTSVTNTSAKLYDLDYDAATNLWVGGNSPELYRIKADKSVKAFPFVAVVRALRVFNNYLYVAAEKESQTKIYRFPLLAEELGPEEVYFDFTANYPGFTVMALTFAVDGDLYLGTDAPAAIVVVHPDKSFEGLYPGLFSPPIISLTWGKGTHMYATRKISTVGTTTIPQTVLKIEMLKKGAPYYGRGDTN